MSSKSQYKPTIGLEIHAELKTSTKMFCSSRNNPDEKLPNVNVCPICLAHPGTLPVINAEAVRQVLRVGIALGGALADYTEFDRKNYFYPDLPKGYQISQYEFPLVSGGSLSGVAITRVHLEEDTASSIHTSPGSAHESALEATLIDFNRAGVPLMELVTEPVIRSAEQAVAFARELQLLLRYLGASEANMEMGQMRVEANISIAKGDILGTKVEIKNLNSFRTMERAVAYEIKRQEEVLESGQEVIQETRGWDENKQATFPQRIKEGSADYRYFPDPDLPSLKLSELPEYDKENLKKDMPEFPWQRRDRYLKMGIQSADAELYVRDSILGQFFEAVIAPYKDAVAVRLASNYIANDLVNLLKGSHLGDSGTVVRDTDERDTEKQASVAISAENFRKIIDMTGSKKISSRAAKDLLRICLSDARDPEEVAAEKNLFQDVSENDLAAIIRDVLKNNPSVVTDYKSGKVSSLEYLVGQSMKELKGAADPISLRALIQKELG